MPNPKYFQNFPTYTLVINGVERLITDITYNIRFSEILIERGVPFYDYVIKDGERPDHVSFVNYGDSRFYWIVLLANDIRDVQREWPMTTESLNRMVIEKYGSIAAAKELPLKYFNREDEIEIDFQTFLNLSQSLTRIEYAYDYETRINDEKRNIKLIQSRYISQAQTELKELFS